MEPNKANFIVTRLVTRRPNSVVTICFYYTNLQPHTLLIRRYVIESQLEEPPKKAVSKAVLFPLKHDYLSC
jgi:hypothetical protein